MHLYACPLPCKIPRNCQQLVNMMLHLRMMKTLWYLKFISYNYHQIILKIARHIVISFIPKIILKNKEIYETIKIMFWFKMLDFTNLSIVLINKVLTKTYSWKNANKVSLSAQECFCEYFVYLKSSRSFYLFLLLTKICTFVIMRLLNFVNCCSMYCNLFNNKEFKLFFMWIVTFLL